MPTNGVSKSNPIDCPECGNAGGKLIDIEYGGGKTQLWQPCKCVKARDSLKRIEKSGLKEQLADKTFDAFQTPAEWQKDMKDKAQAFLTDNTGKWFGCFGQIGAGKTHICTAICGEFLSVGKAVRYMPWRDEVVPLKAMVTDEYEYEKAMDGLKRVEVLYIDDLLWTGKEEKGYKKPTAGDLNIAFELLNYRYNNQKLITIISSQRRIFDLMDIDEAVGSRIYQRCKEYCIDIAADTKKNWRLRK